jgi:hypothetical protein
MTTVRERSITLDAGASLPVLFEPGTMFVGIYRCESTDLLYVRIRIGEFSLELEHEAPPPTRRAAVDLAKTFIREIGFQGRVKWQLGGAGAVTDEPKL